MKHARRSRSPGTSPIINDSTYLDPAYDKQIQQPSRQKRRTEPPPESSSGYSSPGQQ
jgi:hypothetical protein